jgi:hypothetical protein
VHDDGSTVEGYRIVMDCQWGKKYCCGKFVALLSDHKTNQPSLDARRSYPIGTLKSRGDSDCQTHKTLNQTWFRSISSLG